MVTSQHSACQPFFVLLLPPCKQLFDSTSSTYTYLLGSHGEAVLIDPVLEQVGCQSPAERTACSHPSGWGAHASGRGMRDHTIISIGSEDSRGIVA